MKRVTHFARGCAAMVLALLLLSQAQAVPSMINYQGRLTDASGQPVTGTVSIVFAIYGDTLQPPAWTEAQASVTVDTGLFQVLLGTTTPFSPNLFDGGTKYLGISVSGDPEMRPFSRLISVPYSIRAGYAEAGGTPTGWKDDGGTVRLDTPTDKVGIGTAAPDDALDVNGVVQSMSGGFKFPDGTVQTTAAGGSSYWTVTDSVLRASGEWGLARAGSSLYGDSVHTHVNLGRWSSTGISGSNVLCATVGGGTGNMARGNYSVVAGGFGNRADSEWAAVAGGWSNEAIGSKSFIGGGERNYARGRVSGVCAGFSNEANAPNSFVGGGCGNHVGDPGNPDVGQQSAILGGCENTITRYYSSILGGSSNSVEGPIYTMGTILGGARDTVTGDNALAYGSNVYVSQNYRSVFYDGAHPGYFAINRDNRDGTIDYPIHVGTNVSNGNGAYLTNGGTWTNGSSREFKENFLSLDVETLLDKIAALPVQAWTFRNSTERHIGPVAEDFVGAFDVGVIRESDGQRDNQYLAASDVAGVALAGVKEIVARNRELERRVAELENIVQQLLSERK